MVVREAAAGWVDTAVWVDTAGYGCRLCLSSWLSASWLGSSRKSASEWRNAADSIGALAHVIRLRANLPAKNRENPSGAVYSAGFLYVIWMCWPLIYPGYRACFSPCRALA